MEFGDTDFVRGKPDLMKNMQVRSANKRVQKFIDELAREKEVVDRFLKFTNLINIIMLPFLSKIAMSLLVVLSKTLSIFLCWLCSLVTYVLCICHYLCFFSHQLIFQSCSEINVPSTSLLLCSCINMISCKIASSKLSTHHLLP